MGPPSPLDTDHPTVVGRIRELGRLEAFVKAVPSRPQALLIRGESGMGKTTLWRHTLRQCQQAGYQVLRARPAEEEMPVPLVALDDMFRDLEFAGAQAPAAATDPFAPGRDVLRELLGLVRDGPVVLAIDDLQWLDPASARAIRFALRRTDEHPVSLLAAVRSGADERDPLELDSTMGRNRHETLDLTALPIDELRRVLARTVAVISRPMLRRVYEISGGNPLYAIALADGLSGDDLVRGAPTDIPLPDSLRHAIAGRLGALPTHLMPLLRLVAGLGPTTVTELRACAPDLDVDVLLAEARADRLLTVEDDLAVRFTHPMIASVLYAQLGPLERRALHGTLAGRVESPDRRARHLALSRDVPDEEVAGLLEDAAERARRSGAPDVAAGLAGHSRRLTPPDDAEAVSRRSLTHITYLAAAGEVRRALELSDQLIASQPPGRLRAKACINRAELEGDDLTRGEEFLLRGLDDAGDDELLRGEVMDQLGWLRGQFLGDLAGGIALSRQALEIAERLGNRELEMSAASGLSHLMLYAGEPRWDLVERALAIESQTGRPVLWGGVRSLYAAQLRLCGDIATAREMYESTHRDMIEAGVERWRPHSLYALAGLAVHEGDMVEADELIGQALQAARDTEDAHAEAWIRYTQAAVAAWRGRSGEARSLIGQILAWAARRGERPAVARARALSGLLAFSEGDVRAATTELGQAVELVEEMGIANPAVIGALPEAVDAHATAGDAANAARLLERLERQAAALGNVLVGAMTARGRGCVLATTGHIDAAVAELRAAAATFDRLRLRPEAARSVLSLGRAMLRGGHRTAAADAFEDARDRFTRMGAVLWRDRAAEELERAAPGRASGTLTRTERSVASLVAAGNRNKQIGQALFMSVATVEAHLTRIYRKLGIGSRSELTRLVADGKVAVNDVDQQP